MHYHLNFSHRITTLCAYLLGTSIVWTSCKTSPNPPSLLHDDENSNVQNQDFRELDEKAPHLSNGKIDVKHYDVGLKFSSMESTTINASAKITIKLLKPDRHIKLHAEKSTVTIKSASLIQGQDQKSIRFKMIDGLNGDKGLSGSVLNLDLPTEERAGTELTVALSYTIEKPTRGAAKGLMHRVDFQGGPIYATRNWPYYARYWLPSNDHPSDTATFHFNLAVPADAVGAANGALVGGDYKNGLGIAQDGLRHFEWALNTPIPVYGVSVVVGQMEVVQDLVCFDPKNRYSTERVDCSKAPQKIPFVYYIQSKHDEKSKYLKQSQEGIKQMILMSSILGPYPYQKLGFATAPQAFNMESVSMIVMVSPEATTHEVAHHWWGNTVYIEHWGDLWISEGLTSYFTGFYNEIAHGKYKECSSTEGILNNPSDTDPLKIFNDTPYCKGAAAIADLRLSIEKIAKDSGQPAKGRDAFLSVMKGLFENYRFKRLGSQSFVSFVRSNSRILLAKENVNTSQNIIDKMTDEWQEKWLTPTRN